MWNNVRFFSRIFLLLVSFLVLTQSMASAAPQAICISQSGNNGGSGWDWKNAGSWAFCAGATAPPSAGVDAYIQGDVYLSDARSAANVTIDTSGSLSTSTNTLTLIGNLTNNGTMTTPNVTFAGAAAQSAAGTAITFDNLTINNPAGVSLSNSPTVNGTLTLTSGDLSTGSNTLNLGSSATVAGTGDVVGNAKRTGLTAPGSYVFGPSTIITFTTLSAATDFTVNLVKSSPVGFTRSLPRDYTITDSGSPTLNAALQLHYKSSEVTASFTEANLRAWKYDGTSGKWVLQSGSQGGSGNNSFVIADTVTSFSKWAITDNGAPTAVTLSSLKASPSSFDLGAWLTNLFSR